MVNLLPVIPKISKPTAKILLMAIAYIIKLVLEGMDSEGAIKKASAISGIKADILRKEFNKKSR